MKTEELGLILDYKALQIKSHQAATIIRAQWMSFITRKKVIPKILERRKAAIRIQRNFRARSIQRYVKRLKNQAATVI